MSTIHRKKGEFLVNPQISKDGLSRLAQIARIMRLAGTDRIAAHVEALRARFGNQPVKESGIERGQPRGDRD